MIDGYGRKIEYMRISVTDRCNLRCRYCMPEGIELLPMDKILTYEDIALVVEAAVSLGITRFKITGGEPLIRRGVCDLVRMIKNVSGVEQVTLTTNGVLLADYIDELSDAGIDGINISLDTLDRNLYRKITGTDALDKVLAGLDMAISHGIRIKINAVILNEISTDNYMELAELAKDRPVDVRFIELMPIGAGMEYESIDCHGIIQALTDKYGELSTDNTRHGNGPARYYKITGFTGGIGVINSVHDRFCDFCNRIRLTSTGELKPCLCYGDTFSLVPALRKIPRGMGAEASSSYESGVNEMATIIRDAIENKPCGHDFAVRSNVSEKRRMSQIGG